MYVCLYMLWCQLPSVVWMFTTLEVYIPLNCFTSINYCSGTHLMMTSFCSYRQLLSSVAAATLKTQSVSHSKILIRQVFEHLICYKTLYTILYQLIVFCSCVRDTQAVNGCREGRGPLSSHSTLSVLMLSHIN